MCKTNPVWLVGRGPRGTNVQNEPNLPPATLGLAGPIVQNKANSRRCRMGRGPGDGGRGVKCAKRSQFRAAPGRRGLGDEGRGGQSCKTKPIWPPVSGNGRAPAGMGPLPGSIVQNEANFGRSFKCNVSSVKSGKTGFESSGSSCFELHTSNFRRNADCPEAIVRNKPNSPGAR
jgi:hypothetical protein